MKLRQPAALGAAPLLMTAAILCAGRVTTDVWRRASDDFEIYGAVPIEGMSQVLSGAAATDGYAIYSQPIHTDLGILRLDDADRASIVDLGAPPPDVEFSRQALLDCAKQRSTPDALSKASESANRFSQRLARVERHLDDTLSNRVDYDALLTTVLGFPAPKSHPDIVAVAVAIHPQNKRGSIQSDGLFTRVDRVVLLPTHIRPSRGARTRATLESLASTPPALAADALIAIMFVPTVVGGSWELDGIARGVLGVRRDGSKWPGEVHPDSRTMLTPSRSHALNTDGVPDL